MNFETKTKIVNRANERRTGISDSKGPEYTGEASSYKESDANILANFYLRATRGKTSVFSVAQTYAGKHIDSIETALAQLAQVLETDLRKAIVNSGEGLVSRLDDLRNYCDLIECILVEEGIHPEKLDKAQLANFELIEKAKELFSVKATNPELPRLKEVYPVSCESDMDGDGDCPSCVKRGGCFFTPERATKTWTSWRDSCLTDADPGDETGA